MAYSFANGKFYYDTFTFKDGQRTKVRITLNLNHQGMREIIDRALRNSSHKTVEANGALEVKAVSEFTEVKS